MSHQTDQFSFLSPSCPLLCNLIRNRSLLHQDRVFPTAFSPVLPPSLTRQPETHIWVRCSPSSIGPARLCLHCSPGLASGGSPSWTVGFPHTVSSASCMFFPLPLCPLGFCTVPVMTSRKPRPLLCPSRSTTRPVICPLFNSWSAWFPQSCLILVSQTLAGPESQL